MRHVLVVFALGAVGVRFFGAAIQGGFAQFTFRRVLAPRAAVVA